MKVFLVFFRLFFRAPSIPTLSARSALDDEEFFVIEGGRGGDAGSLTLMCSATGCHN